MTISKSTILEATSPSNDNDPKSPIPRITGTRLKFSAARLCCLVGLCHVMKGIGLSVAEESGLCAWLWPDCTFDGAASDPAT